MFYLYVPMSHTILCNSGVVISFVHVLITKMYSKITRTHHYYYLDNIFGFTTIRNHRIRTNYLVCII